MKLTKLAAADAKRMKAIAVVTMLFLPATFVAV
jgi:Mg2+ and Co2+ transporter CorA